MDREILFRGKPYGHKNYVYGFLDVDNGEYSIRNMAMRKIWIVDPKTVGQFTGIMSKRGTRIFENDEDGKGNKVEFCNGSWCTNGDRLLTSDFIPLLDGTQN